MINIIAPPGCYGTYIARCIHHYTSIEGDYQLDFDSHGSSHAFRKLSSNIKKTSLIHWQTDDAGAEKINGNDTIIVTTDTDHYLDYYDNQFYKQANGNLVEYLIAVAGIDAIQERLKEGWQYTDIFDNNIPRWILREYCSFWQTDSWTHGYNNDRYLALPHVYHFSCQTMWHSDMWQLLNIIAQQVNREIHAPEEIVRSNHQAFLNCQQYHGIQLRCEQFVKDTINSIHTTSPCISVFDEAYVQHILRTQGYEIQCYNLNQFPNTSTQLAEIIYETSNHSN